jgi:hypothetical protein
LHESRHTTEINNLSLTLNCDDKVFQHLRELGQHFNGVDSAHLHPPPCQ